jgi:hypothetical protein
LHKREFIRIKAICPDEAVFEKAKAIEEGGIDAYLRRNDFWSTILPEYDLKGYSLEELARLKEPYCAVKRRQVEVLAHEVLTTQTACQVILEPKSQGVRLTIDNR